VLRVVGFSFPVLNLEFFSDALTMGRRIIKALDSKDVKHLAVDISGAIGNPDKNKPRPSKMLFLITQMVGQ
jgi:hypothetical protein